MKRDIFKVFWDDLSDKSFPHDILHVRSLGLGPTPLYRYMLRFRKRKKDTFLICTFLKKQELSKFFDFPEQ